MTGTVRLLPLLAVAALCLAVLKTAGLFLSGGYVLTGTAPASAQADADMPVEAPTETPLAEAAADAPPAENEDGARAAPAQSELDVLESLSQRREALERRDRELTLRENLLRAAETRVEQRIEELKAVETRIASELQRQEDERAAEFDGLVRMYSEMRPKDAARIMNRLDLDVLVGLVTDMQPRVMSAILAQMDAGVAQRLTLEIANRNAAPHPEPRESTLPKIEGQGPS